jgi:PTH1 family peptidyl-tRNA hydrolase
MRKIFSKRRIEKIASRAGAYVIVGLGNPGRQYERTRHNAGFDVIELLAARHGIRLNRAMCKAKMGEGRIGAARAILAQPQTYMNLSGESVKKLVDWHKIDLSRLIICYDDVDLPPGKLRVRAKGSAGTHNGMRSVIYMLGRDDFPRVRVGIGPPPPECDISSYVLFRYETPEARQIAFDSYTAAADLVEIIINDGVESAARRAGELP